MGWWITLAILFLLAVLPIGISVRYRDTGILARVIIGPIRFTIFPRKKKKRKQKSEEAPNQSEKANAKTTAAEKKQKKQQEKGGSILDFLPLVRIALDFLREFITRKLRVNTIEAKIILAGDDPCDLATNYGRLWAALGNLWPRLEEWLVIKKRNVELECDFTASETLIIARVDLTITVGRLLSLAVRYGIRALKEYLKIRKKQKGGVNI